MGHQESSMLVVNVLCVLPDLNLIQCLKMHPSLNLNGFPLK